MYKVKGVQVIGINNIPQKNAPIGYLDEYYGKIVNKDGSVLFYGNFQIHGENDKDTSLSLERTGNYTVEFSEVPCDADGNILMVSHFLTTTYNYKVKISILCSKEPTHRINVITGKMTENKSDNQYIMGVTLSYLVFDKNQITI